MENINISCAAVTTPSLTQGARLRSSGWTAAPAAAATPVHVIGVMSNGVMGTGAMTDGLAYVAAKQAAPPRGTRC